MLERYGHCAKHGGTCNNRANKPDFLRHNVLLLDCRTLERISSTGPATNHSGIEGKRVLSDVCSHKSGHKSARPVLRQVRQLRRYSPQSVVPSSEKDDLDQRRGRVCVSEYSREREARGINPLEKSNGRT